MAIKAIQRLAEQTIGQNTADSPLIIRESMVLELLYIYDVDCQSQRELHSFWTSSSTTPTRAFAHIVPVKPFFAYAKRLLWGLVHLDAAAAIAQSDSLGGNDGILIPDIRLQSELSSALVDPPRSSVGATVGTLVGPPTGTVEGDDVPSLDNFVDGTNNSASCHTFDTFENPFIVYAYLYELHGTPVHLKIPLITLCYLTTF